MMIKKSYIPLGANNQPNIFNRLLAYQKIKSSLKLNIQAFFLVTFGAILLAAAFSLFQFPHRLAAGGVVGIIMLINHYTGWSEGVMFFVMNMPLLILGYFYLGRWQFLLKTTWGVFIVSMATDYITMYQKNAFSNYPLTDDILLSSIYAGIIGGIGLGLVYRGSGTLAGTSVPVRIIQLKTGIPQSDLYLIIDGLVVFAAGLVFGWEAALYALLTLYIFGLACDYVFEGPNTIRTATIITDRPQELSTALMTGLGRGLSRWDIQGGYTGEGHTMLLCTLGRSQVETLKQIIHDEDPQAFVTIGVSHQALGGGFRSMKR